MQNVNYKVAQINGNPNVLLQGEGTHKQYLFPFEKSYDADAAIEMLGELEDVESRDEVNFCDNYISWGAIVFEFSKDGLDIAKELTLKFLDLKFPTVEVNILEETFGTTAEAVPF